jgi:hypothetical protein
MIPLESCYATFGGIGMYLKQNLCQSPAYMHDLTQIQANQRGASNATLVRGDDIADAVKATRNTFASIMPADMPVTPDPSAKASPRPLWLVAYLGSSSGSAGWQVQAVDVHGTTVRLTYTKWKARGGPTSILQYFVWAPLGDARAGTYTLELYDADRKEVMLMRRVVVTEP